MRCLPALISLCSLNQNKSMFVFDIWILNKVDYANTLCRLVYPFNYKVSYIKSWFKQYCIYCNWLFTDSEMLRTYLVALVIKFTIDLYFLSKHLNAEYRTRSPQFIYTCINSDSRIWVLFCIYWKWRWLQQMRMSKVG